MNELRSWLWLIRRYGLLVALHFWRERMSPRRLRERDAVAYAVAYADWYVANYAKPKGGKSGR